MLTGPGDAALVPPGAGVGAGCDVTPTGGTPALGVLGRCCHVGQFLARLSAPLHFLLLRFPSIFCHIRCLIRLLLERLRSSTGASSAVHVRGGSASAWGCGAMWSHMNHAAPGSSCVSPGSPSTQAARQRVGDSTKRACSWVSVGFTAAGPHRTSPLLPECRGVVWVRAAPCLGPAGRAPAPPLLLAALLCPCSTQRAPAPTAARVGSRKQRALLVCC